jgi:hypothetical protein
MLSRRIAIASLALTFWSLRTPSTAQHVGDRIGDTCRVIAIDDTNDTTDLMLYARPIVINNPRDRSPDRPQQRLGNSTSIQTTQTDNNQITLLFDREQVALLNANQAGVDGDDHLWHEIEDSIGNRGYMLAIDPETQRSTLRECP